MLDNDLLFLYNNKESRDKVSLTKDKRIMYKFNTARINGYAIERFLTFINGIHSRFRHMKLPIVINLGKAMFEDKLTICIFETICYNLIKTYGHHIRLLYSISPDIRTEGFGSSPLLLLGTTDKKHIDKFTTKFIKDSYGNHYRRILSGNEKADSNFLCILMSDIDTFLKVYNIQEDCRDEISEVIVELVGNAVEHTKADCLLDIDITKEYTLKETGEICYGINIVILSYSRQLLGKDLKDKILADSKFGERYSYVKQAYFNHLKQFTEDYTEEDFFNISSFQHKISGSRTKITNGGTGLTKLICSLEKRSEDHECYVISGTRVVNFKRDFLEYDNDDWIGFNSEHNFKDKIPAEGIISFCPVCIPGTAYNLNFVMKKEVKDE
ncbi:MAG: hypothetical protein KZY87_20585 [Lachnospiraceae bacterium]|nr:hypothetical protein [Lachnospiraceae bacterium]